MILRVGNEQVPLSIESQTLGFIEAGSEGLGSVTGPARLSGACEGSNQSNVEVYSHRIHTPG
jgi:hypothetical protein